MVAVVREQVTAEDLWRMRDDGYRYELVKGELIQMPPVSGPHGRTASKLDTHLRNYVQKHGIGEVFVELGYCLECRPDTVRGLDVSFLAAGRIPPEGLPEGWFPGAPDLAVEIVSPHDPADDLVAKVLDYLTHGTRLVWVVYPRTRMVTVYHPDGTARVLHEDDVLDGGDVVPGFRLPLQEVFDL